MMTPSWTLLSSPMRIGSMSPRRMAPNQMLTPSASSTSPIICALSAIKTRAPRFGTRPPKDRTMPEALPVSIKQGVRRARSISFAVRLQCTDLNGQELRQHCTRAAGAFPAGMANMPGRPGGRRGSACHRQRLRQRAGRPAAAAERCVAQVAACWDAADAQGLPAGCARRKAPRANELAPCAQVDLLQRRLARLAGKVKASAADRVIEEDDFPPGWAR